MVVSRYVVPIGIPSLSSTLTNALNALRLPLSSYRFCMRCLQLRATIRASLARFVTFLAVRALTIQ